MSTHPESPPTLGIGTPGNLPNPAPWAPAPPCRPALTEGILFMTEGSAGRHGGERTKAITPA